MKSKKFLLYGFGKTNQSIKEYFTKNKFTFDVYVDGIGVYNLNKIDIIIKSPGIKFDTQLLKTAKELNIPVINDLELFYLLYPDAKLIIITGTNGKTSTARMLSIILSKKYKCYLGGNIGLPLFSLTSKKKFKNEIVIVEASSFMLENCYTVKPFVYVITNITKHHLDYHKSFENYFYAKTKLIDLIKDDGLLLKPKNLNIKAKCKVINFFDKGTDNLVVIEDDKLKVHGSVINSFKHNQIIPKHQLLNMSIVYEIATFLNVPDERIKKGFEDVVCEKYRLEVIHKDDDTIVINDAKSTNTAASLAAVNSLKDLNYDLHLILGGHGEVDDIIENTNKFVKKYYLYGENSEKLEEEITKFNIDYKRYNTLEEVIKNIDVNNSKKIILYSPAAQSFDQYTNFEERGAQFNLLINKYLQNYSKNI